MHCVHTYASLCVVCVAHGRFVKCLYGTSGFFLPIVWALGHIFTKNPFKLDTLDYKVGGCTLQASALLPSCVLCRLHRDRLLTCCLHQTCAVRVLVQNGTSHGVVYKQVHANLANYKILKIHLSHVQEVLIALGMVHYATPIKLRPPCLLRRTVIKACTSVAAV